MPTNEERKEVAARLRRVNGAPEWATTACCIAECLGEHDYPLWNDSKPLFNRLADLIEPEVIPCETCPQMDNRDSFILHLLQAERHEWTCRIIEEEPMVFICSECGGEVEDWYLACPYCGCKVVK